MQVELVRLFEQIGCQNVEQMKAAEKVLGEKSATPNFIISILEIIQNQGVSESAKLQASIFVKNFVKKNWEDVQQEEKKMIKQNVLPLLLSFVDTPMISKQIAALLETISKTDFPNEWQELLPQLMGFMKTNNPKVLLLLLKVLCTVFSVCTNMSESEEANQFLIYALDNVFQRLLELFQGICSFFEHPEQASPDVTKFTLRAVRYISRIFYYLNYIGVPQVFEDSLDVWFPRFHAVLMCNSSTIHGVDDDDDEKPNLLCKAQASIAENLCLFAEKYDDILLENKDHPEYVSYYENFVSDAWRLLSVIDAKKKYDKLFFGLVSFLRLVSLGTKRGIFITEGRDLSILENIINRIVIPNMTVRESDVEMFEDTPREYVQQDMEGSNASTRRRAVTEFVRDLRRYFEKEVTDICSRAVNTMIGTYSADPVANWRCKDCVVYLISALAIKNETQAAGSTNVNELVPVHDFYLSQVLPELLRDSNPVIKADCIKFVTIFRNTLGLTQDESSALFNCLVEQVVHKSPVVYTYAANAIDKLLQIKVFDQTSGNAAGERFAPMLYPVANNLIQLLMKQIFATITSPEGQNEYLSRTLYRTLSVLKERALPLVGDMLPPLKNMLLTVKKNPTNPQFNHFLFESIALLIGTVLDASPTSVGKVEEIFLPVFQEILVDDIIDFIPYVTQLLCVIVERVKLSTDSVYLTGFLNGFLQKEQYARGRNVKYVVRFVETCVAYRPPVWSDASAQDLLARIFAVAKLLLSFNSTEVQGLDLLRTVVRYVPLDAMRDAMFQMMKLVLARISARNNGRLKAAFAFFYSQYIAVNGIDEAMAVVDKVQPNLSAQVVEFLWLGNCQSLRPVQQKRVCIIALMAALSSQKFPALTATMVKYAFVLLLNKDSADGNCETININNLITGCALQAATPRPNEFRPELGSIELCFVQFVHKIMECCPGQLTQVVNSAIAGNESMFSCWCQQANVPQPYVL